jgi:hypothetical protein
MPQEQVAGQCNFCYRWAVMTMYARKNSWYREATGLPRKSVEVCEFHKEVGQKYLGGRWGIQR